jgi:hypothetical protein
MYGYRVTVPDDGKFSSNDPCPDDTVMDDEYDTEDDIPDEIYDMYINNSKIGYYFNNIPKINLAENCVLTILMTECSVAVNESHNKYLRGSYTMFMGVVISPDMTPHDVNVAINLLNRQIATNVVLHELDISESPVFIAGHDMSQFIKS